MIGRLIMRGRTSLGVDISNDRISLALLKRTKEGVELLKTASAAVPEGAIKNGNIEDAAVLSKAIKGLKTHSKIQAARAAVSLLARPVLMQIMDIPRQVPTNIGKFVQNELKHCVALSGKEIALDFCGIGSGAQPGHSRIFVVATDGQKVAEVAKACNQAGLGVEAIEPPLLAYTSAFYAKKIAGKFDCNVLMAVFEAEVLTLCVFRNQTVDFVRTKDIDKEKTGPDKLCPWLAEEINAIIRFYDFEVPDNTGNWEITVVADRVQLPDDAEESLKVKVACDQLHVRTGQNICQDTFVGQNSGPDRPSPVAIGLGLKLLGINESNLKINLLPPEAAEVKSFKKDALIAANIAAAATLLMVLTVGGLTVMVKKVNQNITHIKQTQMLRDTHTLFKEQELIERQISILSHRPEQVDRILSLHPDIDWPGLLNDIKKGTPKTVRVTDLSSKGSPRMALRGLASSYEAVHLFVNMLNKSERVDSASLVGTEKDTDHQGTALVRYAISCSLASKKKEITGVN